MCSAAILIAALSFLVALGVTAIGTILEAIGCAWIPYTLLFYTIGRVWQTSEMAEEEKKEKEKEKKTFPLQELAFPSFRTVFHMMPIEEKVLLMCTAASVRTALGHFQFKLEALKYKISVSGIEMSLHFAPSKAHPTGARLQFASEYPTVTEKALFRPSTFAWFEHAEAEVVFEQRDPRVTESHLARFDAMIGWLGEQRFRVDRLRLDGQMFPSKMAAIMNAIRGASETEVTSYCMEGVRTLLNLKTDYFLSHVSLWVTRETLLSLLHCARVDLMGGSRLANSDLNVFIRDWMTRSTTTTTLSSIQARMDYEFEWNEKTVMEGVKWTPWDRTKRGQFFENLFDCGTSTYDIERDDGTLASVKWCRPTRRFIFVVWHTRFHEHPYWDE